MNKNYMLKTLIAFVLLVAIAFGAIYTYHFATTQVFATNNANITAQLESALTENESLKSQLDLKDNSLLELEGQLEELEQERNAEILEKEQIAELLSSAISELEASETALQEKQTLITSLNNALELLETESEQTIAEKETLIVSLQTALNDLQNDSAQELEEKETLITSLNNALELLETEREEVLLEKSELIDALNNMIEQLQTENEIALQEKQSVIDQLIIQLEELELENENALQEQQGVIDNLVNNLQLSEDAISYLQNQIDFSNRRFEITVIPTQNSFNYSNFGISPSIWSWHDQVSYWQLKSNVIENFAYANTSNDHHFEFVAFTSDYYGYYQYSEEDVFSFGSGIIYVEVENVLSDSDKIAFYDIDGNYVKLNPEIRFNNLNEQFVELYGSDGSQIGIAKVIGLKDIGGTYHYISEGANVVYDAVKHINPENYIIVLGDVVY